MAILGTRLGTRLGTQLGGDTASPELLALETYLARNLFSWMRADSRVEAGGKVTHLSDKVALAAEGAVAPNARSVDPGHSFAQASAPQQVSSPAVDPLFSGRETVTFTGAQWYDSTLAATNWKFLHDGTGFEAIVACAPTNDTLVFRALLSARPAGGFDVGTNVYFYGTGYSMVVGNGASSLFAPGPTTSAGQLTLAPSIFSASYGASASPQGTIAKNGTVVASGSAVSAPSAADSASTLRLGNFTTGSGAHEMRLADVLIFKGVPSTTARASAYRYLRLRYPVLT